MSREMRVKLNAGTTQDELADQLVKLADHIRGVKKSGGCLSVIEVNTEGSRWVRIPFGEETGTLSETTTISVYSEKERVKETESSTPEEGNQKEKVGKRKKN